MASCQSKRRPQRPPPDRSANVVVANVDELVQLAVGGVVVDLVQADERDARKARQRRRQQLRPTAQRRGATARAIPASCATRSRAPPVWAPTTMMTWRCRPQRTTGAAAQRRQTTSSRWRSWRRTISATTPPMRDARTNDARRVECAARKTRRRSGRDATRRAAAAAALNQRLPRHHSKKTPAETYADNAAVLVAHALSRQQHVVALRDSPTSARGQTSAPAAAPALRRRRRRAGRRPQRGTATRTLIPKRRR